MPIPSKLAKSFLARQVGSLVLSRVRVEAPMARVRAVSWHNSLHRLGIHLPLFVVHDFGVLLTSPKGSRGWTPAPGGARPPLPPGADRALGEYASLLQSLGRSETVQRLAGWRLRDEIIAVLLVRALGDSYHRWRDPAKAVGAEELPLDIGFYRDAEPMRHFQDFDPAPLWGLLEHLADQTRHIFTSVELIDLDTVRLLGLFKEDCAGGGDALGSALDLVDLVAALGSPEAHDVSHFSLELLPSILETKRSSGAQTLAVDGYASIERKGNVDSLMLSELAYDQAIFEQKVVDHELLYYGHERQREDERRLHYILVDSSASMRGQRQVFARGLALALVKTLTLQGEEIWLRFFDSRLHELIKVGRGAPVPVPYLLSFRSEHGRNYNKVFRQLSAEISRLRAESPRDMVVYIITHGQAHIAPDLIAALAQQAFLYGIIILPSQEVSLDFLPLLHRSQVVMPTTFHTRSGRRDRALDIVGDASRPDVREETASGA